MKPSIVNRLSIDPDKIIIFRGGHVVIANWRGLILSDDQGYYVHHTRFLSRFDLRVDGRRPRPVCCNRVAPHAAMAYYLAPSPAGREAAPPGDDDPSGGEVVQKAIEIKVRTYAGGGYRQDIIVVNHGLAAATASLDLIFAADFADLQEAAGGERRQDAPIRRSFKELAPGRGELTFRYEHPKLDHATRIRVACPGALTDDGASLRLTILLRPQAPETIAVEVAPIFSGERLEPWFGAGGAPTKHHPDQALIDRWLKDCVDLKIANRAVQAAWDRAAADLWSLQSLRGEADELFTPMAGLPKYTGLFGRDVLVAGVQSAMLNPATLRGTLSTLSRWAARDIDDRFDAQPGKILHQRQLGPLALLGENPFLHYYGDYSAAGLFVIGAALHYAHSADRGAFESLRDRVLAALAWMDRDGDIDRDGFYEYHTKAGEGGIKNQGWKDSNQAILYADGSFTPNPIAVAEVQGIYYAAKQSMACLFATIGESETASRLFEDAAALKRRFNERFWMEDLGFFALALGPEKEPVKTIASNAGSCLAYGIVDEDKAQAVADRLLAPDMFSGWGVRTLSSGHPAYNPLSYHLGSVWPAANANICFGLKRYGFNEAFHKVAKAMFDAAGLFEHDRLPEVFGGHPRDEEHPHPGVYPESCSPQAWSASAVVQICHAMAGLTFAAPLNALVVDPALPDWLPKMTIGNLAIGGKRARIEIERDATGAAAHRVVDAEQGLRILRLDPDLPPGKDRIAKAMELIAENQAAPVQA